jgi:ketosteroid isomerase-like protein
MKQHGSEETVGATLPSKPTRRRAIAAGLAALPFATSARPVNAGPLPIKADNVGDLLTAREAVWRQWFAADRKALMEVLPADFVGIGAGDGPFRSREETIKDAEGFVAAGNKLTALSLTENHIQSFGETRVIYCRFSFTVQDKDGKSSTIAGRATEVFIRSGDRWIHPGWHLDSGK